MGIFNKKAEVVGDIVEAGADVAKTFSNKEQGTRRLQIDSLSDTPLSKNIRPMIVIWAFALFSVMIILSFFGISLDAEYKETIYWVLIIAVGFYFPGRTAEKWVKERYKKKS